MPACLLINQYIPLNTINDAKNIIYRTVIYPNSKIISFEIIKKNKN